MKRTGPLARTAGLKRTGAPARRKPLQASKRLSRRRSDKGSTIDRAAILERDRGCIATRLVPEVPCFGALHVHHLLRRSQGGSDDPSNLATLCAVHHGWVHEHPARSVALGLLRKST